MGDNVALTFKEFISHFHTVEECFEKFGADETLKRLSSGAWFHNKQKFRIEFLQVDGPVIQRWIGLAGELHQWVAAWIDYEALQENPERYFRDFVLYRMSCKRLK